MTLNAYTQTDKIYKLQHLLNVPHLLPSSLIFFQLLSSTGLEFTDLTSTESLIKNLASG